MIQVLALNVLFLLGGAAILWGARGYTTANDLLAQLGVAYLLGMAAVVTVATLLLIAGVALSTWLIVGVWLAALAGGVTTGVVRRMPVPRGRVGWQRPRNAEDAAAAALAAVAALVLVVILYAFHREPLIAYDAWNFWIPKAKAIFYFGGLDEQLFRSLPAPSYPLFMPTLDAMAFRFADSVDPALLMLQYWLLLVGLVAAAAALLDGLARRSLIWLSLALFVALPEVAHRWFWLIGDWPLDVFFVVTALLLVRWLSTDERWPLALAPLPLAATLAIKREGQILALALLVGALVVTRGERRRAWLPLGAIFAGTYLVVALPWRLWWTSRHLTSDLAEGGTGHLGSVGRVFGSVGVVLSAFGSYQLWQLAIPIGIVLAVAALSVRPRVAAFYLSIVVVVLAGFTWIVWSDPSIPLHAKDVPQRIPRATGAVALLSLVTAPLCATAVLGISPAGEWTLAPTEAARAWARRLGDALDRLRPRTVVGLFVVAAWVATLGLAVVVRHNGFVYYQGGDQLWGYTLGYLLGHGQLGQPLIGYLWAALLAPLTWVTGPSLVHAYPAIVVVDTVVLLPVALASLYGLARLIAGRRFAILALVVWLLAPFAGVLLTNAGYHQRYTELILPQAFGLTAMTDFPTMVAALVAAYFGARVVFDGRDELLDGLAAGVAAGIAIAIKPSTALFLVALFLALAVARRFRAAAVVVLGMLPAVVTLAVWKDRGYGYLPLLHGSLGAPVRTAAAPATAAVVGLPQYIHFDWTHFERQLDLLREHFWSGRLIEWLVVAGLIALGRRSLRALALVGVWFAAFAVAKGGYGLGSIEDSSLLRLLIPAIPPFVLLVAALPWLMPRGRRPWPTEPPTERAPRRLRLAGIGVAVFFSAVVPFAAIAAATPMHGDRPAAVIMQSSQPLVPADADLGLRVEHRGGRATLTWDGAGSVAGRVFYHVFRAPADASDLDCDTDAPAVVCELRASDLGVTTGTRYVDSNAGSGDWQYRVGVSANWLDDPTLGDVYELTRPVRPR
jgi:hypothetical protein